MSVPAPADTSRRPSLLMVTTVSCTIRNFLRPYATHFRDQGWRVEAASNEATIDPALAGYFDALHELPLSRSIVDIGGMARTMGAVERLVSTGYDIVHVHTPIAAFVTRAAIRRLPARERPLVVYTAHGFHFYPQASFARNAIFSTAERVAGRWTDRLVVINDTDYAAALRYHIVPRRHLVQMPGIGVDTDGYTRASIPVEAIAAARARLAIDASTPYFTVVGELSLRKRPFDAVAALAAMRHRDAHLVLLGEGPERPRVEAAIRDGGVADRVHLVGEVADVRPFVAGATALILASSMEGLPRSIMEALCLEVPVVATDARGNPDLVAPDAGIVVPVAEPVAMAEAMDRILDDCDAARAMGQRGRARMVERYAMPTLLREHEALYAELLGSRAG